ncbi:MAG TPA: acetylornithine carbamoyltransferase, partial [Proteus sp.]|nr:acetylornithine carbamoyltransferase [Proteus sp. (in: enterobacteria)]
MKKFSSVKDVANVSDVVKEALELKANPNELESLG